MDEARFWSLMDQAKAESNGDAHDQMRVLATKLEALSIPEILEYERLSEHFFALAYTYDLWAAGYILNGGCSDDGFEYFRSWLIAQGKDVFYNVLSNPETLADIELPDEHLECQTMFEVAWWAYEAKTGEEMPRTVRFPWEMGKSELSGERWDEDTVGDKYPRLAAASKFWMSDEEWEAKKSRDNPTT
jgi:Protein of unknown function (DUF4240)